jgi:uncharacterized membrane protein
LTTLIRFTNIILAALLAGVSFGIWIGFNPDNLSVSTYVEQQQNMIRSLSVLMASLVVIAAVITILSSFLQRKNKTVFITLLIAAIFLIACIFISVLGNKPINDVVLTWTSNTIPADWKIFRDKWWSSHIMRTITELIALALVTWTSVRK